MKSDGCIAFPQGTEQEVLIATKKKKEKEHHTKDNEVYEHGSAHLWASQNMSHVLLLFISEVHWTIVISILLIEIS